MTRLGALVRVCITASLWNWGEHTSSLEYFVYLLRAVVGGMKETVVL